MDAEFTPEHLIGSWRLVKWTATIDGRSVRPFGGNTTGLLTYTADGRMWGTLMRLDRDDVEAPTLGAASVEERATAAAGYLNYAGTYFTEEGKVVHEVELSLYPNWIGGKQVRNVEWEPNSAGGSDLVLSATDRHSSGTVVFNRLVWRRLDDWD